MNKKFFYRLLFSLFFALVVILSFYTLHWLIPDKILMHNELVTLIFIGFSVLILFPARERILRHLLKEDYSSLSNQSLGVLGFTRKYLSLRSLIHTDFPVFVERLEISGSSLALLEAKRKFYQIYHYRRKKIIAQASLDRKSCDVLCHLLVKHSRGLYIDQKGISKEIEGQMRKLKARVIYPLLYRKVVLGFFVFHDIPRGRQAQELVEVFRHRSTLIAQNYILSQRVIDNRIYDQEFALANRVRKALDNTSVPQIPNYKVQLPKTDIPLMFEFFMLDKKHWVFAIMLCESFTGSTGILLYTLIGRLYSLLHLQKKTSLKNLFYSMKENLDLAGRDSSIKLLLISLNEKTGKVHFITEDKDFMAEEDENIKNLKKKQTKQKYTMSKEISRELELQKSLDFFYRDIPILNISFEKEEKESNIDAPLSLGSASP